jgi:ribonucleoside-diphosphate reductase alpha chain
MKAVENNEDFVLSFTREETNDTITKTINARELFHKICEMNWDYAEPGMLFWDRIENWNMLSNDSNFHYAGTNPCAEEPLPAGGSCLLGSINLAEFVTEDMVFDYNSFVEAVDIAVRALNEVLDEGLELHPLQEQRDSVRDWRQIGLGIFGLADMLIKMNIKYGSKESIALCDKIGFAMADQAINTSADIARDDGVYPKYNSMAVETSPYLRANIADCTYRKVKLYGLNNSQLLTIAPTGSLSSMLGVSGGIEPIFANYYTRKTESLHGHEEYYKVYTPIVEQYMKEHNITDDVMLPDFFVTAQDLDYKNRIEMQAVWQKHIDASISSTVNVPNSFTVEETEDLYMSAWKSGLKGVTIFRDGCKRTGILTTNDTKTDEVEEERKLKRGEIIATDDNIIGLKRKLMTGCGSLHCQAFFDPSNGEFREIYLSKGSSGGCNNYMIGLSRMMSLSARAGVPLDDIVDQLMSTGACPSYAKRGKSKGSCCPMAVGYALKDMHKEFNEHFMNNTIVAEESKNAEKVETNTEKKSKILCPNCGEELVFEGGCNSCKACGWSKCDL